MASEAALLYKKLAEVMGEIGNVPKDGKNQHFGYKFVSADAIADKVRDLLSAKSVAFFAAMVDRELVEIRKVGKDGVITTTPRWVITFEFTFADGESGAEITRRWLSEADSTDDKGINKCATAAEKYFLLKTFVVTSADEPDADADSGKQGKQQQPQRQQATPQRPTPAANQPPAASPSSSASTEPGSVSAVSSNVVGSIAPGPKAVDKKLDKADQKLEMPQVGNIDMEALLKIAYNDKWVKGRSHFVNLINLLQREGYIRDAMNQAQVMEEIRKHEVAENLAKEQAREAKKSS